MSERIKERKERIAALKKAIDDAGDEPIKKVIANFCIQTGVSEYTVRRYLRLLIDAGLVDETVDF